MATSSRGGWVYAVTFVLLLLGTLEAIDRASDVMHPHAREITLDELRSTPPLGTDVTVQCDRLTPFAQIGKRPVYVQPGHDHIETMVMMCELDGGDVMFPVLYGVGDEMPPSIVEGKLASLHDQGQLRRSIFDDHDVRDRSLDLYLDARANRHLGIVLLCGGGALLLWACWIASLLRRRRRNPLSTEHVEVLARAAVHVTDPRRGHAPVFSPQVLAGRVSFAVAACEITAAGLDARRDDGSSVLAPWSEIVEVFARRLPAARGGATFVDVRSTAGSTLRLLPWTRLTGERMVGTEQRRAMLFVQRCVERCPSATLDGPTRDFAAGQPAEQLADVSALEDHDRRMG